MTFDKFFRNATESDGGPYPYQQNFAEAEYLYQLVDVPTGLGKTAMVVLGWLWRRFHARDAVKTATPRRLVYCLPMRVLVEQTTENIWKWLENLLAAGALQIDVPVHLLMGGEDQTDWATWPEREMILVGTQDMLLSRALNRGYGASRARWPMEFGLLHRDCLWVFDEIQLMGPGLATTTQLEAFRHRLGSKDGHGCHSLWISATLQRDWLQTADFDLNWLGEPLELTDDDFGDKRVDDLWTASKPLQPADAGIYDLVGLADEILKAHKPGIRTIVVVNTVRRVCSLYDEIAKKWRPTNERCLVLLHSRFRPGDRRVQMEKALATPSAEGTIIVSTQVIEAGVDVSATTLFTELAPWASLVQRFGRCNRKGEENEGAIVHWIDIANKDAAPYESEDLEKAREQLGALSDVGLKSLNAHNAHPGGLPFQHTHVIRKHDLIDLFDTTPDLAGNDIDIDRFIRDVEETDVRVFWRAWDQPHKNDPPPRDLPAPQRAELCSAPIGSKASPGFRQFVEKRNGKIFYWNFLDRCWDKADVNRIAAGQVYLVHADAGGYGEELGWNPDSTKRVKLVDMTHKASAPESYEGDAYLRTDAWQTIAEHTDRVCKHLDGILCGLPIDSVDALQHAARWHDRGKAHEVFVNALPGGTSRRSDYWAKAPGGWKRYERRHFRHELASALAVLNPTTKPIPDELRDLVAYLVAAHHGKVRLSIRSMPNETHPAGDRRFARGIWDDDILPETDLGGKIVAPEVKLSLEPMELGQCEEEPFKGQPSWAERMIRLRDRLGPFRLAYLEALLRAADWRASQPENHP